MDVDDQRIFLGGVVVLGEGEPALDVEALVFPLDGLELRRVEVGGVVDVGELGGFAGSADVDFRRLVVGGEDVGDEAVVGAADSVLDGTAAADVDFAEVVGGVGDDDVLVGVGVGEQGVAAAVFDEADRVVVEPGLPGGRAVDAGGDVGGSALAVGVDDPDVAAGGALVGHQAADEGDAACRQASSGGRRSGGRGVRIWWCWGRRRPGGSVPVFPLTLVLGVPLFVKNQPQRRGRAWRPTSCSRREDLRR